MGNILRSRRSENGVIFEVEVPYEEATQLKGHYDNVHLFTEHVAKQKTTISSRGKNSVTKYFLIPKSIRKNLDLRSQVRCQKIDTGDKVIFVYVVDKHHMASAGTKRVRGAASDERADSEHLVASSARRIAWASHKGE